MNFSVKLTDIFEIEAQPSLNEDIFISQDSQNEGYVIHSLNILGKGQLLLGDIDQSHFENVFMHISLKLQSHLELRPLSIEFINQPNQNSDFAFAYFQARNAKIINNINLWSGYAVSMIQNSGQFNFNIENLGNYNQLDGSDDIEIIKSNIAKAQIDIYDAIRLKNANTGDEPEVTFFNKHEYKSRRKPKFSDYSGKISTENI